MTSAAVNTNVTLWLHCRTSRQADYHRLEVDEHALLLRNTENESDFQLKLYLFISQPCQELYVSAPQWGAADAEIKVPSDKNTKLKRSPFKAWSRSAYSTCCLTARDFFLAYFYPSGPFTCIFSKISPDDFFLRRSA